MCVKYLVFTGRPNAGKSSLIRLLVGLNVKTGKRAGTTRNIHKYTLDSGLVLVDMPGLGRMLGASKRLENMINDRIVHFLERQSLDIILPIHVFDLSTFVEVKQRLEKKGFISVDVELTQFLLRTLPQEPIVVANKIDKLSPQAQEKALIAFKQELGDNSEAFSLFSVSAKTSEGLSVLKQTVHQRLVDEGFSTPFRIAKSTK
jgi:GTP-binding protein EngB required for normal cell division